MLLLLVRFGLVGVAYVTGYLVPALGLWLAWRFLRKAAREGIGAGVAEVALKAACLGLIALGLAGERVHGAAAALLVLGGLAGMMVSPPTPRLRREMEIGVAADDEADKARALLQTLGGGGGGGGGSPGSGGGPRNLSREAQAAEARAADAAAAGEAVQKASSAAQRASAATQQRNRYLSAKDALARARDARLDKEAERGPSWISVILFGARNRDR